MSPRKFSLDDLAKSRKLRGLSQTAFWSCFGVTQAGGSRYESGRELPLPTAMLIWLRSTGKLTEKDLKDAQKAVRDKRS